MPLSVLSLLLMLLALPAAAKAPAPVSILIFGDSISAGYGLGDKPSWVDILRQRWQQQGLNITLKNASVSGETTSGARARLPKVLAANTPDIVLIELGGNDGLRGMPLAQMRANLTQMIKLVREYGGSPILTEMFVPPNLGPVYGEKFHQSFLQVAQALDVPLLPFFLEKAFKEQRIQADGLHPDASAQPQIAEQVGPFLLQQVAQQR